MDAASIATSLMQAQVAMTSQSLAIATQKMTADAQGAVADLVSSATTDVASAAPSGMSANSAITGRGQVLDISV